MRVVVRCLWKPLGVGRARADGSGEPWPLLAAWLERTRRSCLPRRRHRYYKVARRENQTPPAAY